MEAKDTVMSELQANWWGEMALRVQAERSFKAGIREVVGLVEPVLLDQTTSMGTKLRQITDVIAEFKAWGIERKENGQT